MISILFSIMRVRIRFMGARDMRATCRARKDRLAAVELSNLSNRSTHSPWRGGAPEHTSMQIRPKTFALVTATAALTVAFAIFFAPQFTQSIAARGVQKITDRHPQAAAAD